MEIWILCRHFECKNDCSLWSLSTTEQFVSSFLTSTVIHSKYAQGLNRTYHSPKQISIPVDAVSFAVCSIDLPCHSKWWLSIQSNSVHFLFYVWLHKLILFKMKGVVMRYYLACKFWCKPHLPEQRCLHQVNHCGDCRMCFRNTSVTAVVHFS